jgi:tetratricopeptide (TPR) repeat protein
MNSSPHLQRAILLREQGRPALAEQELRQHLAANPQDGFGQALLAATLLDQEQRDAAERAAREAIGYAPDLAFAHYALARVLADRRRFTEAAAAIGEAIRLEPEDADYHGVRSSIEFQQQHWREALATAETGLQFSAEHVACNNLRAMALVKLGRKSEAGATIRATLAREPENALSHANHGWTLLEQGRRKEAMEHFRESLRLDPTNDWARAGLVEAIKAGNPIYAVMLKYILWMAKLSPRTRWLIIIGGYFGSRVLAGLAHENPELGPLVNPLRILYVAFALLTWLAVPVFNLSLFLHPIGRHALSREQRSRAVLVGSCLLLALGFLGAGLLPGSRGGHLMSALIFGLLALPASAVHLCTEGWPRGAMIAIVALLAALGVFVVAVFSFINPGMGSPLAHSADGALTLYLLGAFASQWIAIWLSSQTPTR